MFKKSALTADLAQQPSLAWLTAVRQSRILSKLLLASFLLNVALVGLIAYMLPLKTVEPIYVEFRSGTNNFVKIAKAGDELTANEALISSVIRSYVVARERVDKTTESERYGRVMAMSATDIAEQFKELYGDKKKGLFFKEGFRRTIEITRDTALAKGVHQVEFIAVDTIDGRPGETRREMIATVGYSFKAQKASYDQRVLNPLGLFVEQYTLDKR